MHPGPHTPTCYRVTRPTQHTNSTKQQDAQKHTAHTQGITEGRKKGARTQREQENNETLLHISGLTPMARHEHVMRESESLEIGSRRTQGKP